MNFLIVYVESNLHQTRVIFTLYFLSDDFMRFFKTHNYQCNIFQKISKPNVFIFLRAYNIIMKWKDAAIRRPKGYTKRCLIDMIENYGWENINDVCVKKSDNGFSELYYIHFPIFVRECLSKYRKLTRSKIEKALLYRGEKSIVNELPDIHVIRGEYPSMGNTIVIRRGRFNEEWMEAAFAEADKKRAEILMKKEREEEELEKATLEEKFSEKFKELFKNIP